MDITLPPREDCVRDLSKMHDTIIQAAKAGDDKLLMETIDTPENCELIGLSFQRACMGYPVHKMLGPHTYLNGDILASAYYFRFSKKPMFNDKPVNKTLKVAGTNFTMALFSTINHGSNQYNVSALCDTTRTLMKQMDIASPPDTATLSRREIEVLVCKSVEFNYTTFASVTEENVCRESLLSEVAAFRAHRGETAVADLYRHGFTLNVD